LAKLPVPAEQGVGRDNRGHLTQPATAYAVCACRESPPVIIGQLQASAVQLAAQDAVFFEEIAKSLVLLAVQPTREHKEEQMESGGIDYHDPEYMTGRTFMPVVHRSTGGTYGRRSGHRDYLDPNPGNRHSRNVNDERSVITVRRKHRAVPGGVWWYKGANSES
jgi:hypothetical protein